MHGTATGPVTGGLFLEGGEAEELRESSERFPITQDQRNTFAGHVRFQPWRTLWMAGIMRYGSGLPFEESDDADYDDLPPEILRRINFDRGRIRANFSADLSVGAELWQSTWLQVDVRNVTNRLNVVNFSGLFSGTAIAPGRQIAVQLRTRF